MYGTQRFKRLFAITLAGMMIVGSMASFGAAKEFPSITLKLPTVDGKAIKEKTFSNLKISNYAVNAGKRAFSQEALSSYKTGKGMKPSDRPDFATYLKFVQNKSVVDLEIAKQVVAAKLLAGQELTPEKIDAKLKAANSKVDQLKALIPQILMGGKEEIAKAQAILGQAVNNPQEIIKQFEATKKQIIMLKKQKAAFDAKLKVELAKDSNYSSLNVLVKAIKASQQSKSVNKDLYAIMVSAASEGFDFNQFTYSGIVFK